MYKPKLTLMRLDGSLVHLEMKQCKITNHSIKLGELETLDISIPYKDSMGKDNSLVEFTKAGYVIRLRHNVFDENRQLTKFFLVTELSHELNETKMLNVKCIEYPFLLQNYNVTLKMENKNLTTILTSLLSQTPFKVGYIDSVFDTKIRDFEANEQNVLESLISLVNDFGGYIRYRNGNTMDDVSFIDVIQEQNIGKNTLTMTYKNYLKSLNQTINVDQVITRLYCYGKDDLSINTINPTGLSYIEDYTYFIKPFEQDANGNVIQNSDYLSDGLCKTLIAYGKKVDAAKGTFTTYYNNLKTYNADLSTKKNELSTLQTELKQIEDELFMAQKLNRPQTEVNAILTRKTAKELQISTKNTEITTVTTNINNVKTQISTLGTSLSTPNNFTIEQMKELQKYVREGVYRNEYITNVEDLWKESLKELEIKRFPQIQLQIDAVNFFSLLDNPIKWSEFQVGDYVKVKDDKLGIDLKAQVTEIGIDYNNTTVSISVGKVMNVANFYAKILNNAISTTKQFNLNKQAWDNTSVKMGEVSDLIDGVWDATKRNITAGTQNQVAINEKGIKIVDIQTPTKQMVLNGGILALTNDGGNSYKTAISADGVVAERLIGKIIMGVNLLIENQSGKYTIDAKGLTMLKSDGSVKVMINTDDGIVISTSTNGGVTFTKKFFVDTDGKLFADEIKTNKPIIANGNNVMINGNTQTIDFTKFNTIIGQLDANNINAQNLRVSAANVTGRLTANQIDATNLYVNAANITGVLSAGQVDAQNLRVNAANITGTLQAGQIDAANLRVNAANIVGTLSAWQIDANNLRVNAANIVGTLSAGQIDATGITAGRLDVNNGVGRMYTASSDPYGLGDIPALVLQNGQGAVSFSKAGSSATVNGKFIVTEDHLQNLSTIDFVAINYDFWRINRHDQIGFKDSSNIRLSTNSSEKIIMFVYSTTSDARLKKNITSPQSSSLSLLRKLDVKDFHYKTQEDAETQHRGLMAQQIQKYIPYAVVENQDGTLGVDYGIVTPHLVMALQEQDDKINRQQKEIDELKKMVQQLLDK